MNAKAVAGALRALADAIEAVPESTTPSPATAPTYYTRRTSPLEARVWDRMVANLVREGRVLKPGRRVMVRPADLDEWVERHSSRTPANDDGYGEFIDGARRRAARRLLGPGHAVRHPSTRVDASSGVHQDGIR